MSRSHTILAGAFLVLSGAVAHPAAATSTEKCTGQNTWDASALETVAIPTNAGGMMTRPDGKTISCVMVKLDRIRMVTWQGDTGVAHLVIQFQPHRKGYLTPPDDPACWDAECALTRDKMQNKEGEYEYRVLVIPKVGNSVMIDPRMIIVP